MAFDSLNQALVSDKVLSHYDPTKRLGVSADASAYGVRAELFNMESNGIEKPIYYASRVLSDAEKNYSETEKRSCDRICDATIPAISRRTVLYIIH